MHLESNGISMAGFSLHLQLLSLPLLFILVPLAYLFHSARRRRHAGLRLPPSPWALPVLGHLHHLLGALPHHRLRDLSRRHGPLMLLRLGELPVVVASSEAAAREILKTHDLAFATRPNGATRRMSPSGGAEGIVFTPYGGRWRQLRKACSLELLSARRVRSFGAAREEEVGRLVRAVAAAAAAPGEAAVDLGRRIASCMADSAAHAIIGSRFEDRKAFIELMNEGLRLFAGLSLPDLYPSWRLAALFSRTTSRMKQNRRRMWAFMDSVIKEHQMRKGDDGGEQEDLVDVLLRIQREGDPDLSISMDNIKTVLTELFFGGSDTSANTLQWAMAELMRNPRVMQKAQNEIRRVLGQQERVTEACLSNLDYLRLVIKETLRLHPPAPLLLPRECRQPCKILGFDVPVGTMVLVNAWAIGRDPTNWDAPEEFMPERFERRNVDFKGADFEFIPFGAGRRICPGITFGLANIELTLASLLYHFDWKLPNEMAAADLDMTEAMWATVRRKEDLLLVPTVRVLPV